MIFRCATALFLLLPGCFVEFNINKASDSATEPTSSAPDSTPDSTPDTAPDSAPDSNPDSNPDSTPDSQTETNTDSCPDDPNKTEPGVCGCGEPDSDQDGDGSLDCVDKCPNDANKTEPQICGCGSPERDCDNDGVVDCNEECPSESVTTASVSSSSDDAEETVIGNASYQKGHISLDSSDLEMTNDIDYHGAEQIIGLRFPNVQVPRNAVIQVAYVEFVADENNSESTSLSISLVAADNAASFSTTPFDLSSRTQVASVTKWNNVVHWNAGSKYKTPNLASALQEVVNRGGWKSGNAVVVLVKGTGIREAVSYDQRPGDAATLGVTYHRSQGT